MSFHSPGLGFRENPFPQAGIACNPPYYDDLASRFSSGSAENLGDQGVDDGFLKGGGRVSNLSGRKLVPSALQMLEDSCLEAAEAKVEGVRFEQGAGEKYRLSIALLSEPIDDFPAGVAQSHEFGHLVESLSRGIIPCPAEQGHPGGALDREKAGMPP